MKFLILLIPTSVLVILQNASAFPAEGVQFLDFLMSSSAKNNHKISFAPDDGLRYREAYEKKYGTRGKDLIEMLGQGSSILKPKSTVFISKIKTEKKKKPIKQAY